MGWKYPRRVPQANCVLDFRDLNDGFLPTVEEDGNLGEQNWSDRLQTQLTRTTDLNTEVSMRTAQVSFILDASDGLDSTAAKVQNTQSWQTIPGLTRTLVSTGGTLYVLGTFQYSIGDSLADDDLAYARFGIQLDGAVFPILVNGDQDFYSEADGMEVGIGGFSQGVDVEGSFPVLPGEHTVDIVCNVRNLPGAQGSASAPGFYNRELIVVEMW